MDRAGIVPDGFFPLKFGRHGFNYLAEAQAAVDAALIQLLVIFSALGPKRGLHEEKRRAAESKLPWRVMGKRQFLNSKCRYSSSFGF